MNHHSQARDDFKKALSMAPKNSIGADHCYVHYSSYCLIQGDDDAYRAACVEMLKRWVDNRQIPIICAIRKNSEIVYAQALRCASRGLELNPKDSQFALGRGAILFRLGKIADARQQLENTLTLSQSWHDQATAQFFLAMAHFRLAQPHEAQQWYAKAAEQTELMQDGEVNGHPVPMPLYRRTRLEHLRAEAKELLASRS